MLERLLTAPDRFAIVPIEDARELWLALDPTVRALFGAGGGARPRRISTRGRRWAGPTGWPRTPRGADPPGGDRGQRRRAGRGGASAGRVHGVLHVADGRVAGIGLLIGGLSLSNTVAAATFERIRDFGIKQALGATDRQLLGEVLRESLAVSLAGGVVGTAPGRPGRDGVRRARGAGGPAAVPLLRPAGRPSPSDSPSRSAPWPAPTRASGSSGCRRPRRSGGAPEARGRVAASSAGPPGHRAREALLATPDGRVLDVLRGRGPRAGARRARGRGRPLGLGEVHAAEPSRLPGPIRRRGALVRRRAADRGGAGGPGPLPRPAPRASSSRPTTSSRSSPRGRTCSSPRATWAGRGRTPSAAARGLLERLGVAERAAQYPPALSGGEQQRVAFCRAVLNDPAVILADEPTGNLDEENAAVLLAELRARARGGRVGGVAGHAQRGPRPDRRPHAHLADGQLTGATDLMEEGRS